MRVLTIELADEVITSLAGRMKSTFRPEVLGKIGGFAAMFRPEWKKYNVSCFGFLLPMGWELSLR